MVSDAPCLLFQSFSSLEEEEKEGFFRKFFREKFEDKRDGNDGNNERDNSH